MSEAGPKMRTAAERIWKALNFPLENAARKEQLLPSVVWYSQAQLAEHRQLTYCQSKYSEDNKPCESAEFTYREFTPGTGNILSNECKLYIVVSDTRVPFVSAEISWSELLPQLRERIADAGHIGKRVLAENDDWAKTLGEEMPSKRVRGPLHAIDGLDDFVVKFIQYNPIPQQLK